MKFLESVKAFFGGAKSKILAWSFQQKIVACVAAAAVVISGTTAGVLLHNAKPEPVPEEEPVVMEEVEEVEEVKVVGNKVEVPTFNEYKVSTDSMVQDLKIYFTDAKDKKISGVPFSVTITTNKKLKSVSGLDAAVATVTKDNSVLALLDTTGLGGIQYNEELGAKLAASIEAHSADIASAESEFTELATQYSDYEAPTPTTKSHGLGALTVHAASVTEDTETESAEADEATTTSDAPVEVLVNAATNQPLTVKEFYLVQKQNDIAAYSNIVSTVDGKKYSDDDGDGVIKIDKIDGGDYVLLCNPQNGYDAKVYKNKVTVKAELEYKKVENIKQEVVADAGDTQPAEAAPVEATIKNTVDYVESSQKKNYTFTAASAQTYAAAGNGVAATSNVVDGTAALTLNHSEVSLYSLNAASANSIAVSLSKVAGTSGGTFSNITVLPQEGISISNSGDTYTISTASGVAATSKNVTFSATYTYTEASSSGDSNESNGASDAGNTENTGGSTDTDNGNGSTESGGDSSGGDPSAKRSGVSRSVAKTYAVGTASPKTETLTVVIKVNVLSGDSAATAADGTKLYKAQDINQPATIADAVAGTQLYTAKEEIIYTGWQTINNVSYYYTKDHVRVTGEQVINGVKYNFGSDGALLPSGMGVDVSKWQGNIDWGALAPNISFAIIRCGYRGSSGALSVDPKYARNMQQAKANGVKVGIYIYSKATNEAMAVEEASLAIQLAQEQGGVSLPIYMDMEDSTQKSLSKDELTAIANAFCATVANAGYRPGVYASYNWWNQKLNAGSVNGSKWVARYNTVCGMACDIWQYSSKGTLPGISGNVDINQSYF